MSTNKVCYMCKTAVPLRQSSRCAPCNSQYKRELRQRRKAGVAIKSQKPTGVPLSDPHNKRARNLRYKYGISLADYARMFHQQGGKCAICRRPPMKGKRLHVDHDHVTGRVRGLLCRACNIAIGMLNEDPKLFRLAVGYVRAARVAVLQRGA